MHLLKVLGAVGTQRYVRKALSRPKEMLQRIPSPTRKDPGNLHGHLLSVATHSHSLPSVQQTSIRPPLPQDKTFKDPSAAKHGGQSQLLLRQYKVVPVVHCHR